MDAPVYWATAAFSLLATWLNIRKEPMCFVIWILTNGIWAAADATHGLPAQAALHVVYTGMAVYGAVTWRRPSTPQNESG